MTFPNAIEPLSKLPELINDRIPKSQYSMRLVISKTGPPSISFWPYWETTN